MNRTNYTTALSAGTSEGSEGWPTISVSRRDAVWLSAGFGFGLLSTMCLMVVCRRCRRQRRRGNNTGSNAENNTGSNAENNAGGNGVML